LAAYALFVACGLALPLVAHGAPAPEDANKKPSNSAKADEKVYVSPQALDAPKPGPITPPKPEEVAAAIERGVKFLLADQRPDGSWGSAEKTKGLNI
jgi:squalene cyclase